jgi:hypothetical protein
MADSRQTKQQLQETQAEIRDAQVDDDHGRNLLGQIDQGIQQILAGEEPLPGPDHPLTERVREAVDRFEASHPSLFISLGHLLNILSNEGI